jgi:hypothetical protein
MTTQFSPVTTTHVAVTRVEVIDHVGEAFAAGPLTRSDILVAASSRGARPAVLEVLERLPDRKFSRPHDMWMTDLRDVPIEH